MPITVDHAAILRERLSDGLHSARKERDLISVANFRTLMAALDNANAVDVDLSGPSMSVTGSADVPRRTLSHGDVTEILWSELDECTSSAIEYQRHGREKEAAELEAQAAFIKNILEKWEQETL
ncbi:MAG: hypothetical protein P8Z37_03950 [Acidobacteriota bacterium]|jgi:uncharacterized protein YqeY